LRIDKTELIASQPLLRVRNVLRRIDQYNFTQLEIAHQFKVSPREAGEILHELQARAWIEPIRDRAGWYEVSMQGRALAAARAITPISRAAADLLMKTFLGRVIEVNSRNELTHYVSEVRVFGSYLSNSADLGDIDLAVELRFRDLPGRDRIKYAQERAHQSGRHFRSRLEMAGYGENEVRRLLKQRSRYISLHPISDIAAIGAKSKVVFVARCGK
jgi:hypothetical protein